MSSIDISILMPVYNGEKYIEKTVNSVINQSFKNWELIIVNDGSTDNSHVICESLKEKDSRIKVIHKENTGVSNTRNILLDNAKGKYIGFVDCDDYIDKHMFEILINKVEEYNSDLVICGIEELKMKDNIILSSIKRVYYPADYMKIGDMKNRILEFGDTQLLNSLCNKLYKRELINDNKIKFDETIENGEDFIFNLEYIKYTKVLSFCNEALYSYIRRDNNSITHKYVEDMYFKGVDIHNKLEAFLIDMEFFTEENKEILQKNHLIGVFSAFLNLFHEDCNLNKIEKKSYIRQIIARDYVKKCANNRNKDKGIVGLISILVRLQNVRIILLVFNLISLARNIKNKLYMNRKVLRY